MSIVIIRAKLNPVSLKNSRQFNCILMIINNLQPFLIFTRDTYRHDWPWQKKECQNACDILTFKKYLRVQLFFFFRSGLEILNRLCVFIYILTKLGISSSCFTTTTWDNSNRNKAENQDSDS